MVQVVVHHVVDQVPQEESGAEAGGVARAHDEVHDAEDDRPQRDRDGRRHHQAHRVVGVVMVDAVDDPVHPCSQTVLGLEVEDEPVQPVLEQGPDRIAGGEQKHHRADAHLREAPGGHQHDGRHEDHHRDGRVHARERIQDARLEHRRRGAQHIRAAPGAIVYLLRPVHASDLITLAAASPPGRTTGWAASGGLGDGGLGRRLRCLLGGRIGDGGRLGIGGGSGRSLGCALGRRAGRGSLGLGP